MRVAPSVQMPQVIMAIWQRQQRIVDQLSPVVSEVLSGFNEDHCIHCEIRESGIAISHRQFLQRSPSDACLASWSLRANSSNILSISLKTDRRGTATHFTLQGQNWSKSSNRFSLIKQNTLQEFLKEIRSELEALLEEFAETLLI
ncbi:hypothetical protein KKF11_00260 [Patescibacteria group bacterium]|nr:hypothetical protein [Patescibacteria group bacterium]